jgi:hypothetical protein
MKMGQSLQQMMERLLARQIEEMEARQEEGDVKAQVRQEEADDRLRELNSMAFSPQANHTD